MRNAADFIVGRAVDDSSDPIGSAFGRLARDGIAAAPTVMAGLAAEGFSAADDRMQPFLIELIFQLLVALESDPSSPAANRVLALIPTDIADVACDLLLLANFGDGRVRARGLGDATLLCLSGLYAASLRVDDALKILAEGCGIRRSLAFRTAAGEMRDRILGIAPTVAGYAAGARALRSARH